MLTASEYDLKIAKGSRSPRISMNHSLTSGYSDVRQKVLGIDPASLKSYMVIIRLMNSSKTTETFLSDLH